jgi:hypothetical protein
VHAPNAEKLLHLEELHFHTASAAIFEKPPSFLSSLALALLA